MINLRKSNNGSRTELFNSLEGKFPATTVKGVKVYVINSGENTANVFEDGRIVFEGFKNINEVISTTRTNDQYILLSSIIDSFEGDAITASFKNNIVKKVCECAETTMFQTVDGTLFSINNNKLK